jgi:hypothetical protein
MMKKLLLFLLCCGFRPLLEAQVLYVTQGDASGTVISFGTLDLNTCTYSVINPGPIIEFQDFCLGPNGEIYVSMIGLGLGIYNPVTGVSTLIIPIPDFVANSVEILPNGTIYAAGETLWEINPVAGTFTVLGPMNISGEGDLAYINGQLYLTGNDGSSSCLVQVNIADPSNSVCVLPLPYSNNTGLVNVPSSTCGDQLFATGISIDPVTLTIISHVYSIDLTNNSTNTICSFNDITGFADFSVPFNYNFSGPCCATNAGSMAPDLIQACVNQPITLLHNNDQVLEGDDAFQFAITTNLNNPAGSILVRQNTNIFTFIPGVMQPDVVYYGVALAGNDLGAGVVNLNDPCLDISNPVPLIWKRLPEIQFTPVSNLCADAPCFNLPVNLIGEAPFNLDFSVSSNNVTLFTGNASFNANTGIVNICPPAGFAGPLSINATSLADNQCICSQ